jgi:hypothetical protein
MRYEENAAASSCVSTFIAQASSQNLLHCYRMNPLQYLLFKLPNFVDMSFSRNVPLSGVDVLFHRNNTHVDTRPQILFPVSETFISLSV